jgi:hypothetical protein
MDQGFETFDPARPAPVFRSERCASLFRHWNTLRGARSFPSRADIDPVALKRILPYVMIVSLEYEPFRVQYRLVGTEVVRFAKLDFTNRYADTLRFQDDETGDWTVPYRQVVGDRRPGLGLTHWRIGGGPRRWVEFVICPLSTDGAVIDRCISLEDYEPVSLTEREARPPVVEH